MPIADRAARRRARGCEVTTLPRVSMMMPEAVACSSAVVTSMRTTDGPIARATSANARDSARASEAASVVGVSRPPRLR